VTYEAKVLTSVLIAASYLIVACSPLHHGRALVDGRDRKSELTACIKKMARQPLMPRFGQLLETGRLFKSQTGGALSKAPPIDCHAVGLSIGLRKTLSVKSDTVLISDTVEIVYDTIFVIDTIHVSDTVKINKCCSCPTPSSTRSCRKRKRHLCHIYQTSSTGLR